MCQATLLTGRLRLVPLSGEHLEYEVELDADPEVMRHLGDGRARSREDVERRQQHRLAAARRVVGLGFWVGFVDGQFVGWWENGSPTTCPDLTQGCSPTPKTGREWVHNELGQPAEPVGQARWPRRIGGQLARRVRRGMDFRWYWWGAPVAGAVAPGARLL